MADSSRQDFGPYVLDQLISSAGGQGMVYLATHKALERRVVIKVLRDHLATHQSFVERFASEAAQLARMDHPNIVRVRQSGPLGPAFYIEMEYIEGWDLTSWLRDHGRMPVEVAVLVLQGVAAGLQHAHAHSVIHRDVKPGNVMLTSDGGVKVLDFGLARDLDAESRSTPGTLMGTYAYMSPEQVNGLEATTAFDVYSLGVLAYQLLAGKPPFEGSIATVCMKILNEEPEPLDRLCPGAPRPLVRLVQRMMAKKPTQRPATMLEVQSALREIAAGLGTRASDDLLKRYVADPEGAAKGLERKRHGAGWRPWSLAAAAALLLLAVAWGAVRWLAHPAPGAGGGAVPMVPAPQPGPAVAPAVAPAESTRVAARESTAVARPDSSHAAGRTPGPPAALAAPGALAGPVSPAEGAPAVTTPGPEGMLPVPAPVSTALSEDSMVVDVRVTPAGDISLDGVKVATAATRWTQRVARAPATVRVDCGDYGAEEQKKKPRRDDAVLGFAFDLSNAEGRVRVSGPRGGLDIYVDGVYQHETTPATLRRVRVGPHQLEVRDRRTGEVVASRQIVVKQGSSNEDVVLSPGH